MCVLLKGVWHIAFRGSTSPVHGVGQFACGNPLTLSWGSSYSEGQRSLCLLLLTLLPWCQCCFDAGHEDRSLELEIRGILEGVIPLGMFPRTSVMVVLQVRHAGVDVT